MPACLPLFISIIVILNITPLTSLTILIRVAHDSLNREKFIKLILTREIVHRPYIPDTIPFIHRIHSKRII